MMTRISVMNTIITKKKMDIEDWFEIVEDEIEYPLMCSTDNIWTPTKEINA